MKTLSSRTPAAQTVPESAPTTTQIADALLRARDDLLQMSVSEGLACCAGILHALNVYDFQLDFAPVMGIGHELILEVILQQGDPITVITVR